MHAKIFLHKLLGFSIHKKRLQLLEDVITVVVKMKQLSLTALGRAFENRTQERSGIQKMNRMLGNVYFQEENKEIYRTIIEQVVGSKQTPEIIVDWSKLPNIEEYMLRASLSAEGRAITLYEEVHPKKKEGNRSVHSVFLENLKKLLRPDCKPIIVTDAGFKNPWFKKVLSLNWDYVGRVRGKVTYESNEGYKACKDLHQKAGKIPNYLGEKKLSKKNSLLTQFYLVRQNLKGRIKKAKNGKRSQNKDSKNYGQSYREPWLLVSSLSGYSVAKKVTAIYKRRMTIEEAFRDTKSSQYGFSMDENKTRNRERLIVWLVIAALASLWAWIVGYAAEKRGLHSQFQANTIRDRRVLSFFYLGCQVIRKKIKIPIDLRQIQFTQEVFING